MWCPAHVVTLRRRMAPLKGAVSELVANAWRHTDTNVIIVRACREGSGPLVIEVWDRSDEQPVPRCPGPTDLNGRGLLILSELVVRWGTRPLTEGGKIVYAEVV